MPVKSPSAVPDAIDHPAMFGICSLSALRLITYECGGCSLDMILLSMNSAEEMKRTNYGCAVQAKRTQPFSLLGHLVMLRMPNVYITVCAFIPPSFEGAWQLQMLVTHAKPYEPKSDGQRSLSVDSQGSLPAVWSCDGTPI